LLFPVCGLPVYFHVVPLSANAMFGLFLEKSSFYPPYKWLHAALLFPTSLSKCQSDIPPKEPPPPCFLTNTDAPRTLFLQEENPLVIWNWRTSTTSCSKIAGYFSRERFPAMFFFFENAAVSSFSCLYFSPSLVG